MEGQRGQWRCSYQFSKRVFGVFWAYPGGYLRFATVKLLPEMVPTSVEKARARRFVCAIFDPLSRVRKH